MNTFLFIDRTSFNVVWVLRWSPIMMPKYTGALIIVFTLYELKIILILTKIYLAENVIINKFEI